MKCPYCEKEIPAGTICSCGYDPTRNYEAFATLTPLTGQECQLQSRSIRKSDDSSEPDRLVPLFADNCSTDLFPNTVFPAPPAAVSWKLICGRDEAALKKLVLDQYLRFSYATPKPECQEVKLRTVKVHNKWFSSQKMVECSIEEGLTFLRAQTHVKHHIPITFSGPNGLTISVLPDWQTLPENDSFKHYRSGHFFFWTNSLSSPLAEGTPLVFHLDPGVASNSLNYPESVHDYFEAILCKGFGDYQIYTNVKLQHCKFATAITDFLLVKDGLPATAVVLYLDGCRDSIANQNTESFFARYQIPTVFFNSSSKNTIADIRSSINKALQSVQ